MGDMKVTKILGPEVPFHGFNSATCPAYLSPGKMSDVSNLREQMGMPVVRQPTTVINTQSFGAMYGAYECLFDNVPTLFIATGPAVGIVPAFVTIRKSIDGGVTFTSISPSSGPFGDTRMTGSPVANQRSRVEFQVIKDRTFNGGTAYDCLIIQNNIDFPRMYAKGADDSTAFTPGSYGMAVVYQPPVPISDGNLSYATGFTNFWTLNDPSQTTYTNPTIPITTASNATPIVVTTPTPHFLNDGDEVFISGVTGNAPANGLRYAKVTTFSSTTFGLYSDPALSVPVAGAGSGTGGTTTYGAMLMQDAFITSGLNYLLGVLYPGYLAGTGLVSTVSFASVLDLSKSQELVLMGASFASLTITGATDPSGAPIVITTSKAHGLRTGDTVTITDVGGNTAANGTWQVIPLTATTFSLDNSQGNASYTGAGEVQTVPIPFFWQQMKVSITDISSNVMVLYDPTAGIGGPDFLQSPGPFLAAYQINYPLQPETTFDHANVRSITFEWTGQSPVIDTTFIVYLLAGSGQFQGTTEFAAAYCEVDSRSMGGITPYPSVVPGSIFANGGPGRIPLGNSSTSPTIADDARFSYDYLISVGNPPTPTPPAIGPDRALLFSQLPGQTDLFLNGDVQIAHWDGTNWDLDNTSKTNFGVPFDQDISWPELDSAYVVMPIGQAMSASTQRLMVGAQNRYWYSGAERPFQFRELVDSDANGNLMTNSPGSFGIDGENIQALLNIGSLSAGQETVGQAQNGVSTVFILTDRTLSWVTGWDAISLNKRNLLYARGTYAPKSLTPSRTGFFFIDTDMRVIEVDGYQTTPTSRDIVDDRLLAIPSDRIPWMWGVERNDRYYLCYTPNGGTENTECLIYDVHESQRLGEHIWLSDTFPPSGIAGNVSALLSYRDGIQTRLIGFTFAGSCIEHETYGAVDDDGQSGVTWSLTFPELKADLFSTIRVRRCGVTCDSNMGTITTVRTPIGRLSGSTSSGSVDTSTPTGPRVVKWDGSMVFAGLASNSINISLSGVSPSGKRLMNVGIEIQGIELDGPDA